MKIVILEGRREASVRPELSAGIIGSSYRWSHVLSQCTNCADIRSNVKDSSIDFWHSRFDGNREWSSAQAANLVLIAVYVVARIVTQHQ